MNERLTTDKPSKINWLLPNQKDKHHQDLLETCAHKRIFSKDNQKKKYCQKQWDASKTKTSD